MMNDDEVVGALAYHKCGPASIPAQCHTGVCGLSLLLVLALFQAFFSRFSGFPPSTKTNKPNEFQYDQERGSPI